MRKILLIDDNEEILAANRSYLEQQEFSVDSAETGIKALACLNGSRYDCIVLDVLLPDLDGFAICKAARTVTDAPILFLSCLEDSDDKVRGLMAGGDDYMTKPYSLKELGARIQAIMRRGERRGKGALPQYDFHIDRDNKIIRAHGKNVLLSGRTFDLFLLFYENPKKSFSKEELLKKIWNDNAEISVVATSILRLKRKVEFAEDVFGKITSSYGSGYCLIPPR